MSSAEARGDTAGWAQYTLDALTVPAFALDRQHRYVAFNAAHAHAMKTAYGADVELGANLLDLITVEEDRVEAEESAHRALSGELATSRVWYGDESKSRRLYTLILSPIVVDGEIVGVAAVGIDETDRQASDEALRRSEERFRATFEQSAIGMAQADTSGRWMQVNDRLCQILGYSREELLTLGWADITYPETMGADLEALHRFQEGQVDSYRTEKRYIRKDGTPVWVDLSVTSVRDENGDTQYMVDMIEDIEDRKQMEQALRDSEARYHALVDAVRDVVFVIDRDDRIQFVNDAAAAWMGRTPQELIGMSRTEVFPLDDGWSQQQAESLRGVRETGEPLYVEHPVGLPGGARWQATSLAPLRDGDGRITGVLGIARDITQSKRAEQRRLGELEQLAHADALTGLPNLRGFGLLSKQAVAQAKRAGHGVGAIYADLDNLKGINDRCGHAAGDQALRDAATILRLTLRSADVIARVGGDEFIVLAAGESEDSIRQLVERLDEGIVVFNAGHDGPRALSVSCGVSWREPGKAVKIDRLVSDADAAMYREKARREGAVGQQSPAVSEPRVRRGRQKA
jgi:diguanylate cyclase (GGDEF)-like protein/PAS domain S-box-containing protein